jgi:hypothetical protein
MAIAGFFAHLPIAHHDPVIIDRRGMTRQERAAELRRQADELESGGR